MPRSARIEPISASPGPSSSDGNKKAPKAKGQRVPRTRNGGTWTSAQFWGAIRSALRRQFRYWKPAQQALKAARIAVKGPHNQKWAFLCAGCGKFFKRAEVEIHHKVAVGSLTHPSDVAGFIERLTPESPEAYEVLCKETCHRAETAKQREDAA